jgi:putative NADH-flavin reductase
VSSAADIAKKIRGADALVSAYGPPAGDTDQLLPVTERFLKATEAAGVGRFILVGGAGSLEVAPGVTLIDSGHLPAAWMPIAVSHAKVLAIMKKSKINWTNFSPAAFFEPGARTGKFRIGTDQLIADEKHESRISMEDYAIALVDELEVPKFERARFTIGY